MYTQVNLWHWLLKYCDEAKSLKGASCLILPYIKLTHCASLALRFKSMGLLYYCHWIPDTDNIQCKQWQNYGTSPGHYFSSKSSATPVDMHCVYFNEVAHHHRYHYNDVMMSAMASQIISLKKIVHSNVCSGADQYKTPKLRVTGLCDGNSPVTGEFPAQRASNAENVFISWRHHDFKVHYGRFMNK